VGVSAAASGTDYAGISPSVILVLFVGGLRLDQPTRFLDLRLRNLNLDSAEQIRPHPVGVYSVFIHQYCVDAKSVKPGFDEIRFVGSAVRSYGDEFAWHGCLGTVYNPSLRSSSAVTCGSRSGFRSKFRTPSSPESIHSSSTAASDKA